MELLHKLIELIRNPEHLLTWGYWGLALIIFLETGAMVFFLPGDSLLVVAGLYTATHSDLSLLGLNALLIPAAILGDAVSYQIGKRAGPHLFNRPRSRLFNPDHIRKAHEFYEKHGGKAIVIARFMPILRTFVPVVAGVGGMGYRRFAGYNIIGGASWVASMTLLGHFIGPAFKSLFNIDIARHVEKVIIVVVFLSILPGIIEYLRATRKKA